MGKQIYESTWLHPDSSEAVTKGHNYDQKLGDFWRPEFWILRFTKLEIPLYCRVGWGAAIVLHSDSHGLFARYFQTRAVPSTYPAGVKSQIYLDIKIISVKKPWLFRALVLHSTRVPVEQYRTCWQSTVVTACPDLLVLSALNMKTNGLLENSVYFCRIPWSHSQEKNFRTRLPTSSCTIESKHCGSSTLYCWHELWPHTDTVWWNKCRATDFANFTSYWYLLS